MRHSGAVSIPTSAKRQEYDIVADALYRITQLAWHRTYRLRLPEENDGYEAYVRPSAAETLCDSLDNLLKKYGLRPLGEQPIKVKHLNDHLTALLIPHEIASSSTFMEMVWGIAFQRKA